MSEWQFPEDFVHYNSVTLRTATFNGEVSLDESGLDIDLEQGSGYMRERVFTHIPIDVMIRLFLRAGYTVTRSGPSADERERA